MHFFKILGFDFLLSHQAASVPESDEGHFCFEVEADPEFDLFVEGNAMNTEAQIVERDFPIRVDFSFEAVTEDVLEGQIRLGDDKGSEEASLFLKGFFESDVWNFFCGRVDSFEAVFVEFRVKNLPGLFYLGEPFPDTGSHQMVLKPAIRSLHLPLGGRTQGVNDLDSQVLQNLPPLNNGVFLLEVRFGPDRVPLFDEFEDRMAIDVILQGTAKGRH